jgi:micrococcal nuclease
MGLETGSIWRKAWRLSWKPAVAFLILAGPALADPCTAPVTGYKPGAVVTGQTRYLVDGDGLCIGPTSDPKSWIEIRLADFFAPELHEPGGREAKEALTRLTRGKVLVCTAHRGQNGRTVSYDRLVAVCTVDGRDVGDLMRSAGVKEGGRGRY